MRGREFYSKSEGALDVRNKQLQLHQTVNLGHEVQEGADGCENREREEGQTRTCEAHHASKEHVWCSLHSGDLWKV